MYRFFFWLDIPEPTLRRIFRDANFSEMTAPPSIPIAPGVAITAGPRRPLTSYKSVKVEWNDERFLLSFEGMISDVVEGLRAVKDSFSRHGYPLEKTCHYYEVIFMPQPVDIEGFVASLRDKVDLKLTIGNEVVKPFSVTLSNVEEPISREHFYKWLHIIMNPDVNAPQKRVILQIVKRDTNFETMLEFVKNMDKLVGSLKAFFVRKV